MQLKNIYFMSMKNHDLGLMHKYKFLLNI